jgi:anti-sigma regulatory factor (Ser/Thr protein kinase)
MPKYDVRDWVDLHHVQKRTAEFAAALGFSKRECGELAIVASELTSNILKYGVRGSIEIDAVADAGGSGVELIAHDCGPPFRNLETAKLDGHDDDGPIDPLDMLKRKGIGGGLGAVLRFTNSFRVEPEPGGKRVHVVRYLSRRSRRPPRR